MVSLQCFYIESNMVLLNKQRFVFRVSGLASFLKNSFKSFYNEVTLQYVLKSLEYDSPLFISQPFRFHSFSFFPYCVTILVSLLFHVS
jgi:hypothetical protein